MNLEDFFPYSFAQHRDYHYVYYRYYFHLILNYTEMWDNAMMMVKNYEIFFMFLLMNCTDSCMLCGYVLYGHFFLNLLEVDRVCCPARRKPVAIKFNWTSLMWMEMYNNQWNLLEKLFHFFVFLSLKFCNFRYWISLKHSKNKK